MLLFAALFGCLELASTFKVLTRHFMPWSIMPDAGEPEGVGSEDAGFAI